MSQPDGFDRLERLRADAGHIAAVAEFVRDVDRWVEDATDAPLQQYLRFHVTAARRRRYRRDKWLRIAAQQIDAAGPYAGAVLLKGELEAFIARGPWRTWREAGAPPAEASALKTALFYVATFNDGEGLSQRTLQDVVGNEWR